MSFAMLLLRPETTAQGIAPPARRSQWAFHGTAVNCPLRPTSSWLACARLLVRCRGHKKTDRALAGRLKPVPTMLLRARALALLHAGCVPRSLRACTVPHRALLSYPIPLDRVYCLGGAEEIRTPDLRRAKAALSQLSYGPAGVPPCPSHSAVLSATQHSWRVGVPGIEPGTSVLSGPRSNRLSYTP